MRGYRLLLLLVCSSVAACGADFAPGAQATIDGSLWQEFAASVRQSAALYQLQLDPDGKHLVPALRHELWQVAQSGEAVYEQVLQYQDPELPSTATILAKNSLDAPALLSLKNSLARFQIFGWDDIYPCSASPTCALAEETTILQVNLNGETKTVMWQTSSLGVPNEARRMAQVIRDAI